MAEENKNINPEAVEDTATEAKGKKFEKLQTELMASKDAHLRILAEYDNYRKRSQKEKEASYGDAKANTLKQLLPVIDNFGRATENKTDDIDVYRKGVEMTINQLNEILKNLEVEAFGEVGEEFDPNIHNAVMTVENSELPENSIAAVFEKGYKMGDRILRFATVQVTN